MEKQNWALHVLVDAKTEYTKQLKDLMCPRIYEGISSLFDSAKDISCANQRPDKILITFQKLLSNIPKWKSDILEREYQRIIKHSDCDWLDDLITAVFVSYTKVLTAIKVSQVNPKKPLDLKVPKGTTFLHKCYIQVAREFWKNPYLFDPDVDQVSYQRNLRDCHKLIHDAIEETIRKQLPVQNILKEYLGDSYVEEDDSDVMSIVSKAHSHNLQQMIQKDIHQSLKQVDNDDLTDNYSHYKLESNHSDEKNQSEEVHTQQAEVEEPVLPLSPSKEQASADVIVEQDSKTNRDKDPAHHISRVSDNTGVLQDPEAPTLQEIPEAEETKVIESPKNADNPDGFQELKNKKQEIQTAQEVTEKQTSPEVTDAQTGLDEFEKLEAQKTQEVPETSDTQSTKEISRLLDSQDVIHNDSLQDLHKGKSETKEPEIEGISSITSKKESSQVEPPTQAIEIAVEKPPSLFSDSKTGEHVPWKSQKLENLSDTSSSDSENIEMKEKAKPQIKSIVDQPEIKIVSISAEPNSIQTKRTSVKGKAKSNYKPKNMDYSFYD